MFKEMKSIEEGLFDKRLSIDEDRTAPTPATKDQTKRMLISSDHEQVVGFRLDDELFGINILNIEEIIKPIETTHVPNTEEFVLGVVNLRGKIVPIIDLRLKFMLDTKRVDYGSRVIVVKSEKNYVVGFLVDSIEKVYYVDRNNIDPVPPNVPDNIQRYVKGVGKLDNDKIITLLDVDEILS